MAKVPAPENWAGIDHSWIRISVHSKVSARLERSTIEIQKCRLQRLPEQFIQKSQPHWERNELPLNDHILFIYHQPLQYLAHSYSPLLERSIASLAELCPHCQVSKVRTEDLLFHWSWWQYCRIALKYISFCEQIFILSTWEVHLSILRHHSSSHFRGQSWIGSESSISNESVEIKGIVQFGYSAYWLQMASFLVSANNELPSLFQCSWDSWRAVAETRLSPLMSLFYVK